MISSFTGAQGAGLANSWRMHPMEEEFVNDDPLASAEQNGRPRPRRRRQVSSVLEPRPRRREQIRSRSTSARERTELFLRENPVPMIVGALAAGLAIGLAIRYASRPDDKDSKAPLDRINWSVLSLPFLWPAFRSMKEKFEESADAVSEGVKNIDLDRYTKPIRKRFRSWTS